MEGPAQNGDAPGAARALAEAPAELCDGRLRRLGEGIGKVVYASRHWVVKRERHRSEVMSLIAVWKVLHRMDRWLPGKFGKRMLEHPGRRIRLLRMLFQGLVILVPKGRWFARHIGEVFHWHSSREQRGEALAERYLQGTPLVPERISFPPVAVKVGGWPGTMVVSEATERVEATLHDRINELARAGRFDEIEVWLNRFLALRQEGWKRGVFSLDAHLKNFGVTAERVVLLDAGGLTDRWEDVEARLAMQADLDDPHVELGLERTLRDRPDIAERFDAQWRATVSMQGVREHWPETSSIS